MIMQRATGLLLESLMGLANFRFSLGSRGEGLSQNFHVALPHLGPLNTPVINSACLPEWQSGKIAKKHSHHTELHDETVR